jgi:hypothetical protein
LARIRPQDIGSLSEEEQSRRPARRQLGGGGVSGGGVPGRGRASRPALAPATPIPLISSTPDFAGQDLRDMQADLDPAGAMGADSSGLEDMQQNLMRLVMQQLVQGQAGPDIIPSRRVPGVGTAAMTTDMALPSSSRPNVPAMFARPPQTKRSWR